MGADNSTLSTGPGRLQLAGSDDTRVRFSGPPGALTGFIPLINTGADKQKIRSVGIRSEKLLGSARAPLAEIPFSARLAGGEQARVPATLALDPQTAPGAYDFELMLGDHTMQATAYVSEVVNLRLDPREITILAGAAISYTRTLVVENAGNVPLPTGAECEAPVFDSYDLKSSFLIGLSKGDRQSAESMTRSFLNEWAGLAAGTLVTKRKPMILAPGQKLAVEVEFQLPSSLKPLRHYTANLQLYNATLFIDIYTTVKAGGETTPVPRVTKPKEKVRE